MVKKASLNIHQVTRVYTDYKRAEWQNKLLMFESKAFLLGVKFRTLVASKLLSTSVFMLGHLSMTSKNRTACDKIVFTKGD